MSDSTPAARHGYRQALTEIHAPARAEALEAARRILTGNADLIAETFYADLMADPEAKRFLSHQLVATRLKASHADWMRALLMPLDGEAEMDRFLARQAEVGAVHARINLPIQLMHMGARVIKREAYALLGRADLDRSRTLEALWVTDELVDTAVAAMNDSYVVELLREERASESLDRRHQGAALAMICERQRAGIHEWLAEVLPKLHRARPPSLDGLPPFRASDTGRWILEDAAQLINDRQTAFNLTGHLERIDAALRRVHAARTEGAEGDDDAFRDALAGLSDHAREAADVLGGLSDRVAAAESGHDVETGLFSRRALASVLRRQTELANRSGITFSVLLMDVKGVTEPPTAAEALRDVARTGDWAFRVDSHRFLLLLPESGMAPAEKASAILRKRLPRCRTGLAIHDGQPDYTRLLTRAEAALE